MRKYLRIYLNFYTVKDNVSAILFQSENLNENPLNNFLEHWNFKIAIIAYYIFSLWIHNFF